MFYSGEAKEPGSTPKRKNNLIVTNVVTVRVKTMLDGYYSFFQINSLGVTLYEGNALRNSLRAGLTILVGSRSPAATS